MAGMREKRFDSSAGLLGGDEMLCKECHVIEASHGDLCSVCYFGDNAGSACDPGECEYPGCENNPNTPKVTT